MKFQVEMSEPRPCLVNVAGEKRRALCHLLYVSAWTHGAAATIGGFSAGQETRPEAIVEYENGQLDTAPVGAITMLNSAEVFAEFSWEREKRWQKSRQS